MSEESELPVSDGDTPRKALYIDLLPVHAASYSLNADLCSTL